jgi:hypothetical protein
MTIGKECPAGKGALVYSPPGRCPSWSPGNELKCLGTKGHAGLCHAQRHYNGGPVTWTYLATPEEEDRKEEAREAADLVSDRILQDLVSEDQ